MVRPSISFPILPAFNEILAGPEGTLWVQHLRTAEEIERAGAGLDPQSLGAPRWDIFDADGRFLGVLELPDRFQPTRIRDDRIYGIWRDEMDVEYVLRLRIVGLGEEAGEQSLTVAGEPAPSNPTP